ncbi:DUF72 domain-containing protein [Thermosphaera chiliense]|uniref:DUF72 domain-containing protein n=1 Tax=Thermosphaera chiliense TaxID=3402707 RepID=A0A7M1UTR9_9CREN|nr:DUF72 domain-containing protein [Thermosphaera aggregans]QOR94632.1 DUF72 domain-containing protein [Thermosphaera aggregans]
MKTVITGCCGFPTARGKYYSVFKTVELQNTFYDLPSVEWASSIRKEAPQGFSFAVKAWQVLTHPSTSPTWRRMRRKPGGNPEGYGFLKPSRENIQALEKTLEVARALDAFIVVFQTPASMPFNQDVVKWVDEFFEQAVSMSGSVKYGWEPRGEWARAPVLKELLSKHGVIHVTDLLKARPVFHGGVVYTRLHGLGEGEVNYSYKYTDKDLEELALILKEMNFNTAYVMFNNVSMLSDASRFKQVCGKVLGEDARVE